MKDLSKLLPRRIVLAVLGAAALVLMFIRAKNAPMHP